MRALVRRDIPLLLSAIWDAKCWQESIADAHNLEPWHRTADTRREMGKALRLANRYARLRDRISKSLPPGNSHETNLEEA
jgi:hypothetical protein